MEAPIIQRICHVCGENNFTVWEQYENEVTVKCTDCDASVKYSSSKDLTVEEKE